MLILLPYGNRSWLFLKKKKMVPCVRKVNEILNSFEWQKVERNVFRPKLDFLNDRSPHRSVSNHIHRIVPFFHSMFNWTHRSVVNHSTFYFYLHVVSLLIFATTFVSAIVLFTHVGSAFFSLAFCLFRYFLYISDVYMPVFFFVVVFFFFSGTMTTLYACTLS